jgi:NAD(P)H-hydrate epimerase
MQDPSAAACAWTGEEARAFDLHLQRDLGLHAALLLASAGAAVAATIAQLAADGGFARIVLLAGTGHNGADAMVAARHLAGGALQLRCILPLGPPRPGSLGEPARECLRRLGLDPLVGAAGGEFLDAADLVVDGLFGVGLDRPLVGAARALVEAVNAVRRPVLAVDLPSGLHADTGEALGAAVAARWTLTFVGPKAGLLRAAGPACVGEVRTAQIGTSAAYAQAWLARRRAALSRRS